MATLIAPPILNDSCIFLILVNYFSKTSYIYPGEQGQKHSKGWGQMSPQILSQLS